MRIDFDKFNSLFSFFTKDKKIFYATIAMLTVVLLASIGFAATVFTTKQTLTVPTTPPQPSITVYQSDGTTQITNNQVISTLWAWNPTLFRFEITLKIKNNGASTINPTFSAVATTGNIDQWSLTQPSLSITAGATETANIFMTPNTHAGGETTGEFNLNINVG